MNIDEIRLADYEFLDFGCSAGGSLERYSRLFRAKGKGLGLDVDRDKVERARAAGFDAAVCDLTDLSPAGQVRFVLMAHFLEHVPSLVDVASIVRNAARCAREFVFIRQPYFDADSYLFLHGLKLYWSHWSGHPNNMTMLELRNVLEPLLLSGALQRYTLYGLNPIRDSGSPFVHNLDTPVNQHHWDEDKHSRKRHVVFTQPVYQETMAVLDVDGKSTPGIERIFHQAHKLYDSLEPGRVGRFPPPRPPAGDVSRPKELEVPHET